MGQSHAVIGQGVGRGSARDQRVGQRIPKIDLKADREVTRDLPQVLELGEDEDPNLHPVKDPSLLTTESLLLILTHFTLCFK